MLKKFSLIAMVVGLFSLPACNSSSSNSLKGLSFVPSDATAVVTINNPGDYDSAKQATVLKLAKFTGAPGAKDAASFNEFLDKEFSHAKPPTAITFAKDVKPWLDGAVVVASLPLSDDDKRAPSNDINHFRLTASSGYTDPLSADPGLSDADSALADVQSNSAHAMILPSKNDKAANAYLTKDVHNHPEYAGEVANGALIEVDGKSVCSDCTSAQAHDKAVAKVNAIKAVKESTSILSTSAYKDLKAKSSGSNDGFAFYKPAAAAASSSDATDAQTTALMDCYKKAAGITSTDVSGFATASISSKGVDFTSNNKATVDLQSGTFDILNGLPDSTILGIDINGLGTSAGSALDCLSNNGLGSSLDAFQQQTGLSLKDDVFGALKGETVISIGDITAKEIGLVSNTDEATGTKLVGKLNDFAAQYGQATGYQVTTDEANVYSVYTSPVTPDVTFGYKGGRLIFAGSYDYFKRLEAKDSSPLSANAAFSSSFKSGDKGEAAFFFQPALAAEKWASFIKDADTRKSFRDIASVSVLAVDSGDLVKATGSVVTK